jgi:hypothetical protein
MHDQAFAATQGGDQIFGATRERADFLPSQPSRKVFREGKAEIAALELDCRDATAGHDAGEATAYSFDFGQLGHSYCLSRARKLNSFNYGISAV